MNGKFWKPGTRLLSEDVLLDKNALDEGSLGVCFNPLAQLSLNQQRQELPIFKHRTEIIYLMEKFRVLIVVGETGSGKTTQLPQYLYEAGWTSNGKCIACTQPRRVSAVTVAQRVCQERGSTLGDLVGYTIQFDNCCSEQVTRIKYLTDGMLIREMMLDPLLSRYSIIMIDEAHERTIYTDLVLGLIKKILKVRKDLGVIISSATVDAEMFQRFFDGPQECSILSVQGRCHPVTLHYASQPVKNYIQESASLCVDLIQNQRVKGDILVFLSGQDEIEQFMSLIELEHVLVLALHAGLSMERQLQALTPNQDTKITNKIIASTNIAETSVTVPGIVYVIDCGVVKQRHYDPYADSESLVKVPVSKHSASQRAGRAGRTQPGHCYRMYTKQHFDRNLKTSTTPQMQISEATEMILQLKALGVNNVHHFDYISAPPTAIMIKALETLYLLGAIDSQTHLTKGHGTIMCEMPIPCRISKCLLEACDKGCGADMLTLCAMTSLTQIWTTNDAHVKVLDACKNKFAVIQGDLLTYMNIYHAYARITDPHQRITWCQENHIDHRSMARAVHVRSQLKKYTTKFKLKTNSLFHDDDAQGYDSLYSPSQVIVMCYLKGHFHHVARRNADHVTFTTLRGDQIVHIHPSSVLFKYAPPWIVYGDLVQTDKKYVMNVSMIDPEWLNNKQESL
ncbi:DHX35 [Acrasis kona]|uniref:RNA helicase n=1 Tax=Acrasis kona TaxID=1008807 RepID=A0AAW2Z8I5_9EUKA